MSEFGVVLVVVIHSVTTTVFGCEPIWGAEPDSAHEHGIDGKYDDLRCASCQM